MVIHILPEGWNGFFVLWSSKNDFHLLDRNSVQFDFTISETKINYGILKRKERAIGQKLQTLTDYPEMIRIGRAIVESIDNYQSWPDLTTILSAVSNQEGKWWSGNRDW